MTNQQLITRSGHKRFRFADASGSVLQDREVVRYCKSLGIPPAWNNVKIAVNRRAKVLATGLDKDGRLQYIYHPNFRAKQESVKFERVLRFAKALPDMRETVDRDLKRKQLDYKKVMATIISIMDQSYIRVGNDSYAEKNNSYGLTTLRSKHTDVKGDTITFDFIGKSGKHHTKHISDRNLARIVKQLDELPGYEVFKYYDADKTLHDVKSSDVNHYIKDTMGEEFSAKDFRTWAGTLLATTELLLVMPEPDTAPVTVRERKKYVTACVTKVSKKLGNTPAVARASYIDPRIMEMYLAGGDMTEVRKTVQTMKHKKGTDFLSPEERCVLDLLTK